MPSCGEEQRLKQVRLALWGLTRFYHQHEISRALQNAYGLSSIGASRIIAQARKALAASVRVTGPAWKPSAASQHDALNR
jgi:hypothetical protein